MYKRFDIVDIKGRNVTEFLLEGDAKKYLIEGPNSGYKIKKRQIFTPIDWILLILVIFVLPKLFGFIASPSGLAAYFLYDYLEKRLNKFIAFFASCLFGCLIYLILYLIFIGLYSKDLI